MGGPSIRWPVNQYIDSRSLFINYREKRSGKKIIIQLLLLRLNEFTGKFIYFYKYVNHIFDTAIEYNLKYPTHIIFT